MSILHFTGFSRKSCLTKAPAWAPHHVTAWSPVGSVSLPAQALKPALVLSMPKLNWEKARWPGGQAEGDSQRPLWLTTLVTHLSESQIPSYQWGRKNIFPVLQLLIPLGGSTLSYINSSFNYNIQNLERSQMAINSWISKWWYICTMRSEPLIHMTTWKNLKISKLSERNQTLPSTPHKKGYLLYIILFIYNSRKCRLICIDRKYISTWGWKEEQDGITKRHEELLVVMGLFIIFIVMVISQV